MENEQKIDFETTVFVDCINRLHKLGLSYMLTGSLAMSFYTVPRMTRDIDIVVELIPENTEKIYQGFKDSYYLDQTAMLDAVRRSGMFNAIHSNLLVKIDFIIRKNIAYRRMEFQRRTQVRFKGVDVFIVGKEDLIISKLFWAKDSLSPQQLTDVRSLIKSGTDEGYLDKWAQELELFDLLKECRNG